MTKDEVWKKVYGTARPDENTLALIHLNERLKVVEVDVGSPKAAESAHIEMEVDGRELRHGDKVLGVNSGGGWQTRFDRVVSVGVNYHRVEYEGGAWDHLEDKFRIHTRITTVHIPDGEVVNGRDLRGTTTYETVPTKELRADDVIVGFSGSECRVLRSQVPAKPKRRTKLSDAIKECVLAVEENQPDYTACVCLWLRGGGTWIAWAADGDSGVPLKYGDNNSEVARKTAVSAVRELTRKWKERR
jgi:hypothetical protein